MKKFLNQAEKILKNKLNYIHPWDMERCTTYYEIPKSWNETPNGDDEWVYMRSRMGYFDGLIEAYKEKKDRKYPDKIFEIIYDFMENHKELKYEKSTRTLDSGIRIANILRFLIFLEKENIKYSKDIVKHLEKTCDYLFDSYISKYDQSNWGFIQMAGVYTYAVYFGDDKRKKKSYNYLKMQLETQILYDGLHWEKSMTYHYQMVIYLIWIVHISKLKKEKENIRFFKKYLSITTEAAKKLHYPDNTQINFGDSDDNEVESILALSDYILNKDSEYELSEISKMFILETKKIKNKRKNVQKKEISIFNESGYYHLKNGNFSFSCYATPMSSAHTHIDFLHFNYYNKNKIFVDNGRYTYTETELRFLLKSAKLHNSIIIDDTESSVITGSWDYKNYPVILPINAYKSSDFDIVELSIFDTEKSCLINRKFLILGENVIVVNNIKCKGKHSATFTYNLFPKTKISENRNEILLNENIRFLINGYNFKDAYYSPSYNEIQNSKAIFKNVDFENEYFEINAILKKEVKLEKLKVYQKEKLVDDSIAQAFRISLKKDKYIVFIKSQETYEGQKVFHIEGKPFYGNLKCIKE